MAATGISIGFFVTLAEIQNLKKGTTMIVGWVEGQQPSDAIYKLSAPIDACDITENQVRVNTTLMATNMNEAGEKIGVEIGKQLQIAFKQIEESLK